MKIGITGATGQLGAHVLEQLKKRTTADSIVALVRDPSKIDGVAARAFDYEQPETLEAALKGIDTLLLISSNELGRRASQHKNVIKAAQDAGVKRVVYTSLLHADTSSLSLADEHLITEETLKASGLNYTILRNGWYTENYTGLIPGAVENGALVGSAGEGQISSATRKDFAEAAAVVLTTPNHEGKVYELSGDEHYTLEELAGEISKQAGKEVPYQNLKQSDYSDLLKGIGVPDIFAEGLASWDVSASKGDLFDQGQTLSQLIGRPTTSLTEAVKAALN